jgi:hypothetical protein
MHKPYSIKIFLPGGDPGGIRTIEKSNWSGAGLVVPRAMMAEAKARPGVIQGRAANGHVDWKTKDGRTLRELQDSEAGS